MIVWVIILIVVIVVMRDNIRKQQRQNHQNPGQPVQQNYQSPVQQVQQRLAQQMQQRPMQQQRPVQPVQQNYQQAPQRAAYQQANGRYSRMPNPKQPSQRPAKPMQGGGRAAAGGNQPQPNDILSRAAANVRENEVDELLMRTDSGRLVTDEPSELLQRVNDLMVMGYQADLSFERDFVAEGIELLNRYEISTEVQEARI